MTKAIIEMAREAGWEDLPTVRLAFCGFNLERFAALVRAEAQAEEREACAKVCDELHPGLATKRVAEAIRARGNK